MAQSNLIYPLESLHGKISKKSKTVFRRKAVYDENGNVLAQYAQESYVVEHPRDWKKNPAKGAEKVKQDRWSEACAKTKAILRDPEQRALWPQRWQEMRRPKAIECLIAC